MSNSEAFDPTAPEGEVTSRGQYMTRRDMKVILTSVAIFGILCVPVYRYLLGRTDSSRCTRNMQGINEALTLYATEHDGRYPPIDRTETLESIAPALGDTGHVYTWASDISGYMNPRSSFLCPSAKESEVVITEDPKGQNRTFLSSYGMYSAYGSVLMSLVENPDQTVIIAETSNNGASGTADPCLMKSTSGLVLPDGFVVGWNDSNDESSKLSQYVTRLAFPDSAGGKFVKDSDARHGATIHVLTASGQLVDAGAPSAIFAQGRRLNPQWTVPATTRTTR